MPADRIETGTFGTDRLMCNPSTEQCSQREGRVEVLVRASNERLRSGDLLRVRYTEEIPRGAGCDGPRSTSLDFHGQELT